MSFQSDQLEREYNNKIVSGRRQQDDVFCFLHFDSPKHAPWIGDLMRAVEEEFGGLLSPWDLERMRFLAAMPPHNAQYAVWWGCVSLLPAMAHFLVASDAVRKANTGFLAQFLHQCVPDLVQSWLVGSYRDVHSWVRHVRTMYAVTVPFLDCHYLPSSHPTGMLLTQ
jgi:hypothetical protein